MKWPVAKKLEERERVQIFFFREGARLMAANEFASGNDDGDDSEW